MKIHYGHQDINADDILAVVNVLKSDFLTQGPQIDEFEKTIAQYCGTKHAVAVSNATAALHIACLGMGLGPDDNLWTVPNTFVASANCGLYCGAKVDFVDIDPETLNISINGLKLKLEKTPKNSLPKILIPVHFGGQSVDMERVQELSTKFGFKILEDASHAIGGKYLDKPIGSCTYSDAAVFSFHPVKIITSGEGGMILTNNSELYEKLLQLRTHGITRKTNLMKENHGPWYYEQLDLGFNYRLTDIQAALGLSQFGRVDKFVKKRHEIAKFYDENLKHLPLTLPRFQSYSYSALHLYVVRLKLDQIKKSKKQIFEDLHRNEIMVNLHYIPVHLQPFYRGLGFEKGMFPEAEKYYEEAMTLPMYPTLTDTQLKRVVDVLGEVLK